jgi:alpha-D-xyloside xylohydrolase
MGPIVQYSGEKPADAIELRVYEGANGKFTLYEDENDNYNYEKGLYSTVDISWNDSRKTLTISARKGSFPGMVTERKFNVVNVARNKVSGIDTEISQTKVVIYKGKKVIVKLNRN